MKQSKISHYSKFQFIYGIYSLLIALDYFEKNEDYNECYFIIKGIEENEKKLNCKFYKKLINSDYEELNDNMKLIQKQNAKKLIEYEFN